MEALGAGLDDSSPSRSAWMSRLRAAVHRAEPTGGGDGVLVETDGFTVDPAAKAR